MTHEDALQLIAVAHSLDGWMWWVCFWIGLCAFTWN